MSDIENSKKSDIVKRISALFKSYGEINELKDKYNENVVFLFKCNPYSIIEEKIFKALNSLRFLLVSNSENEVRIYCFYLCDKKEYGDSVLEAVNTANKYIKYGNFYIDSDDTVSWKYSFDATCCLEKDIYVFLKNFLETLVLFSDNLVKIDGK